MAAIAPQPQPQRDAGVPPLWNSYVSVASADAAAERATELGATVHAPPFDVMTVGRMAVIQDPQGAFFMLWQPGDHDRRGAGERAGCARVERAAVARPGRVGGLLRRPVRLADRAGFEGMQDRYLMIKNAGANNGGIRELTPPSPPNWLTYFGVQDVDQALAKVDELGGSKLAGPIDIEIAKLAVVADPQGAVFALYAGELDD